MSFMILQSRIMCSVVLRLAVQCFGGEAFSELEISNENNIYLTIVAI